ncbi:hypervirulence associated TUDOR domain-containing protein [Streptomyces erythrochromogenes]|uniref:DUF2945 domain-containing protein n=1 Tax=Streptomyces erythrochromogenes TaxID=285574 RepID=UPI0037F954D3
MSRPPGRATARGCRGRPRGRSRSARGPRAAGRTVDAPDEQPQYEAESEASGRPAVHRPDALRKKGRSGRRPRTAVGTPAGRR